jgi:hypothetical protein
LPLLATRSSANAGAATSAAAIRRMDLMKLVL